MTKRNPNTWSASGTRCSDTCIVITGNKETLDTLYDEILRVGKIDCTNRSQNGYCPYCGSADVQIVRKVPRCLNCRTVFMLSYSRKLRGNVRKAR